MGARNDTSAELEGNILKLLSDASGDILEDEVLIQTLSQVPRIDTHSRIAIAILDLAPHTAPQLTLLPQSKVASEDVAVALQQASVTEARINDTRVLCVFFGTNFRFI